VGHSFGGWAALAVPDVEPRIRSVVALAPGGASEPRPGVLPLKLAFHWGRDIPTLFLVAENDVSLPLAGMYEIFERTPATKRMVILRRADHLHFVDNVEQQHEAIRNMNWPAELAWLQKEMRPIAELCSGEQAHHFIRGLTLSHLDATLRQDENARRFLAGDLQAELASRGVDVMAHNP
jgi:pimeloyl-ACP methyl ester carboxylesterase